MLKNPRLISLRVVVTLAGISLLSACATPTYESMRSNVDQRGIPYWKQAAAQIQEIRNNVDNRMVLAELEKLEKDYGNVPDKELLQRTVTSYDFYTLEADTLWQRWMLLTQNADGRFAYYYAYNLGRTRTNQGSLMMEAAVFLMLGRISLSVDAARCGDNSVYPTVKMQMENNPVARAINEYLAKVSQQQRADMLMLAVSLEEMRGERKPQAWLCHMGSKAAMQAMRDEKNIKTVPSNGSSPPNVKNIFVDTSKIVPQYIDEVQWREGRKVILVNVLRSAASGK